MAETNYEAALASVQVPPELQALKEVMIRMARDYERRLNAGGL